GAPAESLVAIADTPPQRLAGRQVGEGLVGQVVAALCVALIVPIRVLLPGLPDGCADARTVRCHLPVCRAKSVTVGIRGSIRLQGRAQRADRVARRWEKWERRDGSGIVDPDDERVRDCASARIVLITETQALHDELRIRTGLHLD